MLPDLLRQHLKVVFCGTAAGRTSTQAQAYYGRRGNRFWRVLYEVGLTDRSLDPENYAQLLQFGIGLTDLVKAQAGSDTTLARENFRPERLTEMIATFRPRVLAFNGKRAGQIYLGRRVVYGLQDETIAATAIFVLPSTSGAACRYWDPSHWRWLASWLERAGPDERRRS